jgi:hypothetical protein
MSTNWLEYAHKVIGLQHLINCIIINLQRGAVKPLSIQQLWTLTKVIMTSGYNGNVYGNFNVSSDEISSILFYNFIDLNKSLQQIFSALYLPTFRHEPQHSKVVF